MISEDILQQARAEGARIQQASAQSNGYSIVYIGWSGCSSTPTHLVAQSLAQQFGTGLAFVNYEESVLGWPRGSMPLPELPGRELHIDPRRVGLDGPGPYIAMVDDRGRVVLSNVRIEEAEERIAEVIERRGASLQNEDMMPQQAERGRG